MSSCIFCKIASGEVPAQLVHKDEQAVAFHDLSPQAPVHVLVIPAKHLANLAGASAGDEALLGHLLSVARKVAADLDLERGGYRVVANVGSNAGQSVDHLHIHVLGGRKLGWPPG